MAGPFLPDTSADTKVHKHPRGLRGPSHYMSLTVMEKKFPIKRRKKILDANQITSLSAMISYVAHNSGQSAFSIERALSNHFHIANPQLLEECHFNEAICYLERILPLKEF